MAAVLTLWPADHHASTTFLLLQDPLLNFIHPDKSKVETVCFCEVADLRANVQIDATQYKALRKVICGAILATGQAMRCGSSCRTLPDLVVPADMSGHFEMCKKLDGMQPALKVRQHALPPLSMLCRHAIDGRG